MTNGTQTRQGGDAEVTAYDGEDTQWADYLMTRGKPGGHVVRILSHIFTKSDVTCVVHCQNGDVAMSS